MILRWVCKDCETKWIYPVEECIHCNGDIKRVVGKEMKVVGFSKVSIPSISHPITPYNIAILEDEHGHRMPKKTMKTFDLGDKFVVEKTDDSHGVAIVKVKYDYGFAVEFALSLIPKPELKGKKIFLKPSVMSGAYPYLGMTTNPYVLEGVLKYLFANGVKKEDIVVGETVQFGDFERSMKKSEIFGLCKKYELNLVDIQEYGFEKKKAGGIDFEITKLVFENDFIINVPVMKTHMMLGISGALENMTRIISNSNFKDLMGKDVNDAIYQLHTLLPKQLIIGDATIGIQGNGPLIYGEPSFLNRVMASNDPVAIDKIYTEMCLLRKAPHVEKCGDEGLGENELVDIDVVGDELDACRIEVKQPIGSRLIKNMM